MRNSVYFQINRNGLLILFAMFSVPHRERETERDPTKPTCGFNCARIANVRHSCTAEKVHSEPPRASLMSRTVRQGSRPFVLVGRNLGEGQGVILGKVTDERKWL